MDLFAPHGARKSTLWPASRKKLLRGISTLTGRKIGLKKINIETIAYDLIFFIKMEDFHRKKLYEYNNISTYHRWRCKKASQISLLLVFIIILDWRI